VDPIRFMFRLRNGLNEAEQKTRSGTGNKNDLTTNKQQTRTQYTGGRDTGGNNEGGA